MAGLGKHTCQCHREVWDINKRLKVIVLHSLDKRGESQNRLALVSLFWRGGLSGKRRVGVGRGGSLFRASDWAEEVRAERTGRRVIGEE